MSNSTCSRLILLGSLCFLVLFHGSFAQLPFRSPKSSRLTGRSDCQIKRVIARESNRKQVSEAGISEFWDSEENDELECAGVQVVRHSINPKGLLLPYYTNTPELVYVVRGQGLQGTVLAGCEETFETSFPSGGGRQQFTDSHQRVYRYKEGAVLALPAGAVHWTYNDGETPIVVVALRDTSNVANQLDRNFRKFFLAGNPQSQVPEGGSSRHSQQQQISRGRRGQQQERESGRPGQQPQEHGQRSPGQQPQERGQQQEREWERPGQRQPEHEQQQERGWGRPGQRQQERRQRGGRQEQEGFNMYAGFEDEILEEVFEVDNEIVRQLKGLNDNRGLIVLAENFKVLIPEREQEQFSQRRGSGSGRDNGIEQTICSTQFVANIASPALADVYNPRGGRVSSLNSHKLPVLGSLQLSAEKGVLYKNALLAPHYNLNAHSIIYITSGSSRLQIVGNEGSAVFDGEVREGQLIVVPQHFAVIKKAGEQGCEWVAFKTNDNAITTQLAGRFSYVRALPEEVLANSYDISREQARDLKYSRNEGVVLSSSSRSSSPVEKAENAVLNALFG